MYWDIQRPLSYGKLFNFIVGPRGGGKTYGAKKFGLDNFLKKDSQFFYVRRYDTELEKINQFWDDIAERYPDHELTVNSGKFLCDKEICGHYNALTKARVLKSTPFPKVTDIIFDEFIIDKKGYQRYLTDEVVSFLEMYSTIARLRDVRVWFLSNALTMTNPYFLYWDINLPYGKDIAVKDDILIQMVEDNEYKEAASSTRFGKLISGTAYGNYAIENQFFRDDKSFLGKKPPSAYYQFTLAYKERKFGIWLDRNMSCYYVSNDIEPNSHFNYSVTLDDHKPNLLLLKTLKPYMLDAFIKAYSIGAVRFEDINIKNLCQEIIKLTL